MQLKLPLVSLATVSLMGLLAAPAVAQTKIYNTDNVGSTGTCNVIPFGSTTPSTTWSNQKYQTIMASSLFGKKTGMICSLGFAACQTGIKKFTSIEIKMDYFPGTGSTLTTTFSNNITSKATTVLSATNYVFHTTKDQWAHVGLQKPFLYIPTLGHLVVQITVMGAEGSGNNFHRGGSASLAPVQRMYATGGSWVGGKPPATGSLSTTAGLKMEVGFDAWALDTFGVGCQGSNNKIPQLTLTGSSALGQFVTLGLTDALPSASMFLVIGVTAPGTPVDMGMYGAPSCTLYPALDIIVPTSANASGAFTQRFPMPTSSSMVCSKAYVQFFPHDKSANSFGASSSFYGRVLVGR
ncbi:MAG: hypothetical protein ACYST0_08965 [Planctomycetota bacterium]|jgi:hypothetical protein